jgi:predicted metal-dependent hydrolase
MAEALGNKGSSTLVPMTGTEGKVLVPVTVERSARRKHVAVEMGLGGSVVLKLPLRGKLDRGLQFLREQSEWVLAQLQQRQVRPELDEYLRRHPFLTILGERWPLEIRSGSDRSCWQIERKGKVVRFMIVPFDGNRRTGLLEQQLLQLLMATARGVLPERVFSLAKSNGITIHGVTVRNQKSRWGSCSETSGISLNWRLLLLKPDLQDHIILHELAHVKEFNHSTRFHELLRSWDPRADHHAREVDAAAHLFNLGRLS